MRKEFFWVFSIYYFFKKNILFQTQKFVIIFHHSKLKAIIKIYFISLKKKNLKFFFQNSWIKCWTKNFKKTGCDWIPVLESGPSEGPSVRFAIPESEPTLSSSFAEGCLETETLEEPPAPQPVDRLQNNKI